MPRFSIQSPNGRVKLTVTLREGALHYTAEKDGVTVVDRSPLGLLLRQADLSCGLTLVSSNYASIQETYTLPAFKKSPCENHANTLTLLLEKHEETLQSKAAPTTTAWPCASSPGARGTPPSSGSGPAFPSRPAPATSTA